MLGLAHQIIIDNEWADDESPIKGSPEALIILLPLLIILSTLLFLLLFLISIILLRRRRSIALRDLDGPVDLSREESIESSGQFENIESNWLQSAMEEEVREYFRAKGTHISYPSKTYRLMALL